MRRGMPRVPRVLLHKGIDLIPIALSFDRCPLPGGYRGHAVAIGEERIPSLAACLDDVLVALPDPHAELIATQILPDVLDRVEPGRIGALPISAGKTLGHLSSANADVDAVGPDRLDPSHAQQRLG